MDNITAKMISNSEQLCSARRVTLTGGSGDGSRLIQCSNGLLGFILSEDRCLDIAQLYYRGMNIGFLSKNGLAARRGGFMNVFPGGMLYTCGLDSLSLREGHEMHGRIHNIAADEVCVSSRDGVSVSGVMRDTALFGQCLELSRTITAETGSPVLRICDTLTNLGWSNADYALLYHINAGYPFLTPAVTIEGDFDTPVPSTSWARKGMGDFTRFAPPSDDSFEQVFFHNEKSGCVRVTSPDAHLIMTVRYTRDTLPCLTEWKSPLSGDYALGIEPATSHMGDCFMYRSIAPGESVEFGITLEFEEIIP